MRSEKKNWTGVFYSQIFFLINIRFSSSLEISSLKIPAMSHIIRVFIVNVKFGDSIFRRIF